MALNGRYKNHGWSLCLLDPIDGAGGEGVGRVKVRVGDLLHVGETRESMNPPGLKYEPGLPVTP